MPYFSYLLYWLIQNSTKNKMKQNKTQVFLDISPWDQPGEFLWDSHRVAGCTHNLTECCLGALRNGPPITDEEGSSQFTPTCLLLLIFYMLLFIVLINISLITIDTELLFRHLRFWVFLSVKFYITSVHFPPGLCVFFLGVFSFFFPAIGMNSSEVLDVSNILAPYVNFIYCIIQ